MGNRQDRENRHAGTVSRLSLTVHGTYLGSTRPQNKVMGKTMIIGESAVDPFRGQLMNVCPRVGIIDGGLAQPMWISRPCKAQHDKI